MQIWLHGNSATLLFNFVTLRLGSRILWMWTGLFCVRASFTAWCNGFFVSIQGDGGIPATDVIHSCEECIKPWCDQPWMQRATHGGTPWCFSNVGWKFDVHKNRQTCCFIKVRYIVYRYLEKDKNWKKSFLLEVLTAVARLVFSRLHKVPGRTEMSLINSAKPWLWKGTGV